LKGEKLWRKEGKNSAETTKTRKGVCPKGGEPSGPILRQKNHERTRLLPNLTVSVILEGKLATRGKKGVKT